jgi:hypothetical protein
MASTYREPARTTARRIPRILVAGLLVVVAAIAAASGYRLLASSATTAALPVDVPRSSGLLPPLPSPPRDEHRGPLGEADGAVPDGTTVFDDEIPGVANLDPALLGPLRQAPQTMAPSSTSPVAGDPRSTRNNCSVMRSRSTDPKRKPPGGWPPRTRHFTCRGTRSTSGPRMPRRGCPSRATITGCARSTATNPGTTSCAPKRSITVARPCMPTPPKTRGCNGDQRTLSRVARGSQSGLANAPNPVLPATG